MKTFQHLSSVILRTPLFPRGTRPDFREGGSRFRLGLKLASPAFLQTLDATEPQARPAKQQRSLLRYQLRATGRCTPFGTFAGLQRLPVEASAKPKITLAGPDAHRIHARLDARCIDTISQVLPRVRRYRLNSSLYPAGNEFRYAQGPGEACDLSALSATPVLKELLPYAAAGLSYDELLQLIADLCGVPAPEAAAFLEELIRESVIVDADSPALTGGDALDAMIAQAGETPAGSALSRVQARLGSPGFDEPALDAVGAALERLHPDAGGEGSPVQIDTYLETGGAAFPADRLDAILSEFTALSPLAVPYRNTELDSFRQRFAARYGTEAVPLLEALDPDFGIGYGSDAAAWTGPLLEGISFGNPSSWDVVMDGNGAQSPDTMPAPRPESPDTMPAPIVTPDTMPAPDTMPGPVVSPDTMPYQPVVIPNPDTMPAPKPQPATYSLRQLVQRKYLQSVREGAAEIVLSDEDLQDLQPASVPAFARTFPLMGSMHSEAGDWRFDVDYAGGATALGLLARFAVGDAGIDALCRELETLERDAEPDAVLAEIVHLPAAALGNVSRRPVFREYEIPYLGVSGAAPDRQIDAGDLMLQLHGGELCLFSRRLGRRVLPRLSTAHNFNGKSLPVYRFLCELQFQGLSQPAYWDWGTFRSEAFLPAVRYKHLRLRRRSWHIAAGTLQGLAEPEFDALRRELGIPDQLRCGHADQQLVVDLRNADELRLLLAELRADPSLRIEDATSDAGDAFVQDRSGAAFANELIIPVVNPDYRPAAGYDLALPAGKVRRSFHPGSGHWHYLRLQCGYAAAETILREGLGECLDRLLAAGVVSRWFFVRYQEQSPELRVRFLLRNAGARATLDAALGSWLQPHLESGLLSRVILDTYVRELERYGADAIEEVERIFAADSSCTLRFLNSAVVPGESERFRFALTAVAAMLDDAGLTVPERIAMLEPLAEAFFREHGGTLALQQSLNLRYRELRNTIAEVLEDCPEAWTASLAERSLENRPAFGRLRRSDRGLRLLPDLLHMHVNRVFYAGQRRYELLIYHCLLRHYRSAAVRNRTAASSAAGY